MQIIKDDDCTQCVGEDDANLYLITVGKTTFALSARNNFVHRMIIQLAQDEGVVPKGKISDAHTVLSLKTLQDKFKSTNRGFSVPTIVVRPIHAETEVYILPRLPKDIIPLGLREKPKSRLRSHHNNFCA